MRLSFFFFFALILPVFAYATEYFPLYETVEERELGNLDFTLIELGVQEGMKILVLGGIQGDEPGSFNAASLLSTHYSFSNAQIFIIPNLNPASIIAKSRGIYGDMNRKFAELSEDDEQYNEVRRLQEYILEIQPDIIFNMHDGSGFYSPEYISELRSPLRWGQCVIIDQAEIDAPYGNLEETADSIVSYANNNVEDEEFQFVVYNTHTDEGNVEMEQTLTWFAVRNNIASYGLEVSKEFDTQTRVFYHLTLLEAIFENYGIDYERNFPLSVDGVDIAMNSNLFLRILGGRIIFPLLNIKDQQAGYIPLPENVSCQSLQPIVFSEIENNTVTVYYGNNTLFSFNTQEYTISEESPTFTVLIDEVEHEVSLGEIVPVSSSFFIEHQEEFRVNAIGARREIAKEHFNTEADVELSRSDFDPRYAIDEANNIYRIEIYHGADFVGMFLVDFSENPLEYSF